MFKLTTPHGVIEAQGIDINVWDTSLYGSGPHEGIRVTGYPMRKDAQGYWETNTDVILFSATTNFDTENYHDEWYGLSEDTTPGDMPYEVLTLVNSILKEISL